VIFIGKASARPTENRNTHIAKRVYYVASHTLYVGNGRILTDKKTFVDASSEMLAEMTVDILVYVAYFLIGIN
jgi:hypothetical protein